MTRATPVGMPLDAVTVVGNATTVIRYGGFTLLTDPNFLRRGQWAYLGYGAASRRRTDPAVGIAELPPLDAVVLSHLHGDHFDRVARRGLDREVPIVSTPAAARRLSRYGFRTRGLRSWDAQEVRKDGWTLTVTAVPGKHGPGPVDLLLPPVMGTILEFTAPSGAVQLRIYVSGDTLVHDELGEIRARYPDIDLALLHLGGTRLLGVLLTMDGTQGADLLDLLRPRRVLPVHLDDYGVFRSPPEDFAAETRRRGTEERVVWVPRGETLDLGQVARNG